MPISTSTDLAAKRAAIARANQRAKREDTDDARSAVALARADYAAAKLAGTIQDTLENWPITPEQRADLAALLRGVA